MGAADPNKFQSIFVLIDIDKMVDRDYLEV